MVKTTTKIIFLIETEGTSTGEAIYTRIKELLFSGPGGKARELNFMGIACDRASNMISTQGAGAANQLKETYYHIWITHDLCHMVNLSL